MSFEAFPTWLPVAAERAQPVEVLALLPVGASELDDLYTQLWDRGIDDATLELCRTRITSMVTGTAIAPSPQPESDAQRAALAFAEQFVLDPHGCTDEQMLALQTYFSGPELATLTTAIAVFDAVARVRAVLALPQEEEIT